MVVDIYRVAKNIWVTLGDLVHKNWGYEKVYTRLGEDAFCAPELFYLASLVPPPPVTLKYPVIG